jgi:DNA polymerase elongation subunit (family B)
LGLLRVFGPGRCGGSASLSHPLRTVRVVLPRLYGLDIETDTSTDGLDPRTSAVVAVALCGPDGDDVFVGDEATLLAALDRRIGALPPGVLVTWNGSAFDLPFLADRAARCGVDLGLRLRLDPLIPMRRDPLPGHEGAYRAGWYGHGHLDAYRLYRCDVPRALPGVSCSLKAIARLVGLECVEVDRGRIHELPPHELAAYAVSDAVLARTLAERRWGTAQLAIDPHPPLCSAEVTPGVAFAAQNARGGRVGAAQR